MFLGFFLVFFFFQAEDGIRDYKVTGVQTCAPSDLLRPSARKAASCMAPVGFSATGCPDRKSTRLNSSHLVISYAVFCLKKQKIQDKTWIPQNHASTTVDSVCVLEGGSGYTSPTVNFAGFFFLEMGAPPSSPLFPHRTLFR